MIKSRISQNLVNVLTFQEGGFFCFLLTLTQYYGFFSTVNVEEWLASAQAESLRAEEEAESLRSSQGSVFTDGSMVSDLDNT